ncbi:hypothetical protein E2C01_095421 [Portunus trituberculatus]|uniref:Uncharacterized protein n=1 Tax=Portunus trituberculatus TaxID=210409 RepID=A0A5B7K5Q2_PORTR|nr:hypothetical protein [Portunus trituberculatus]
MSFLCFYNVTNNAAAAASLPAPSAPHTHSTATAPHTWPSPPCSQAKIHPRLENQLRFKSDFPGVGAEPRWPRLLALTRRPGPEDNL